MDAGKIKVVPNALWEAVRAARSTSVLPGAAADDAPVFPGRDGGGINPGSGQPPAPGHRQPSADGGAASRTAALVARSDALAARADALALRADALAVRADVLAARAGLTARSDALASATSVLVSLSTDAIAASKDPQLLARALRAGSSLLPIADAQSARPSERLADGSSAPLRKPADEAHTETRSDRLIAARVDLPQEIAEEAAANPLIGAARPHATSSSTPTAAGAMPPPLEAATPRIEAQQAAPFLASAAVMVRTALPEEESARASTSSLRPIAELIAPLLLRQEPRADRAPYLNRILVGAVALGTVLLLLF